MCYQRIVLKLSGEALGNKPDGSGICPATLAAVGGELGDVHRSGIQVGIVVGGGNIFRGLRGVSAGMDRVQSDHMGMLATVINALAIQDALERAGTPARVMTALEARPVAEPYLRRRAIRHLEKGRLVIFAAGTGNPYFSTDTAAALRALEIGAQVLFKASKVEGIYDRDPERHPEARLLRELSYDRFLADRLGVMDQTAVALCRDHRLPVRVFRLGEPGNILRICRGEPVGTLVSSG
ncbi:MAG: UMP kinase [Deltaproteobacteria bacterium]|nr:UMP kinase [Deltaproteobacteria bacterium]